MNVLDQLFLLNADQRTQSEQLLITIVYCEHMCYYDKGVEDDASAHPFYLPKALNILAYSLSLFQGPQYLIPILFCYAKLIIKYNLNQCFGSAEACLRIIAQILGLDSDKS